MPPRATISSRRYPARRSPMASSPGTGVSSLTAPPAQSPGAGAHALPDNVRHGGRLSGHAEPLAPPRVRSVARPRAAQAGSHAARGPRSAQKGPKDRIGPEPALPTIAADSDPRRPLGRGAAEREGAMQRLNSMDAQFV